jgi:hypothetical protein
MPSEYKGSPTASQAPSPAPSLGSDTDGDPVGNLPADGDTFNASAFIQGYKVALDWIAFLRRSITAISFANTTDTVTIDHGSVTAGQLRIGGLRIVFGNVYDVPSGPTGVVEVTLTFSGNLYMGSSGRAFAAPTLNTTYALFARSGGNATQDFYGLKFGPTTDGETQPKSATFMILLAG